jgi:demethylmenaquinone methyltransferase/2-methoxy-6-polyprenyl-1,4-benzoquinol methylase
MNAPVDFDPPERTGVRQMFDRIAHRYDLLNHLLSFGTDFYWRANVARFLRGRTEHRVADIATGTVDQLLALYHRTPSIRAAVGIDLSGKMLDIGQRKLIRRGLDQCISLVHGDALKLPLRDASVTAVTVTFGIRNIADVPASLREMFRILETGGKVVILEFSLPANRVFRALYLFYLRHLLPVIGGCISGDRDAYRYLNRTVETFPSGAAFSQLLADAGFSELRTKPLTMGIATIYYGEKH